MRFFPICITLSVLILANVGCIRSIQYGGVLTRAPEQMYVRMHSVDLRFVLHNAVIEDGIATVTQVPALTSPPTETWQIRWGYVRVHVPVGCSELTVRVAVGTLNIHPITVANTDGTYTLVLEEELPKEGRP